MIYVISDGRTVDVAMSPPKVLRRDGCSEEVVRLLRWNEQRSIAVRCVEAHLRRAECREMR